MKVVVRAARGGTLRYWLRCLFDAPVPIKTEAEDRDAPTVLATSPSGAEYVLLRTGSLRQANRAADRFRRELEQLGDTGFRERYGLPQEPR